MDRDADRVANSSTPRTLRRRDHDRPNSDPYSDEEIRLIEECRKRNEERELLIREQELLSRREVLRDVKRIVVGGIAAIMLIHFAADKAGEAYWAERPFHDSGEIMTLEWGETWLNKMYIPVANKYKNISVEDVEHASKQLNQDYEKGIDVNGKPSKGSGNTDLAGSSKRVPAFDVELADNSDKGN